MVQKLWTQENRKILVCVDSYQSGIFRGRFFTADQQMQTFDSLSQFLIRIEDLLDENRVPQAYTACRTFSELLQPDNRRMTSHVLRQGLKATFELQVLFRQHSSWQGLLYWQDKRAEHSFRSVLELVVLMDSALRSMEGSEAV